MLEILALIMLTRRIGEIAEQNGYESKQYKILVVVLWFGGEIIGVIVGAIMFRAGFVIYITALLGAACGAGFAFIITNNLSPINRSLSNEMSITKAISGAKRSSKDPNEIVCSNCKFEQWAGYSECQKCGARFS